MKRPKRAIFIQMFEMKSVGRRLLALVKTPFFWWVTFWGNVFILSAAVLFHWIEGNMNPSIHGFLDSLFWAVGLATTVGSGNIHPITPAGKVLSIFMMMGGALFLWSYMAIFVGALVDPELRRIEREVSEIQHDLQGEGKPMNQEKKQ